MTNPPTNHVTSAATSPAARPEADAPTGSTAMRLTNSTAMIAPLGHYSHVAVHNGVAYISGQLPLDADGAPATDESFETQARMVLRNVDNCLAAAGTDRHHLISVTVYVTDIDQWPEFDKIYAEWIGSHRPARAVAGVSSLHYGAAVEVHAVAAIDVDDQD
ncbi:RidA family protein [Streptomyces sp. NBC_01591]|uniref:RidA family protein n=1 Tax=Streptomyces sp. NBC_01591 TaxID=2975888 RepID=UPI002DDC4AB0|nr:RidA family protein [Streptomyces sp. NBC_01591]WSD66165.1 RidA family protein [Streptomyces sp. NBC_01591]